MLNSEELAKELEDRSVPELRVLHAQAIREEAEAKSKLVKIRQWVANLPTDIDQNEEKVLAEAKSVLLAAGTWLKIVEEKLGGHPATPTTN